MSPTGISQSNIYSTVSSNKWKSFFYILFFFILVVLVGTLIGRAMGYGLSFAGIMLIISGVMSFVSYYYSDKIVLSTTGARVIKKNDNPRLYRAVENMSIASGLPMPRVCIIQDPAPNAFATGRDPKHSAVAVTTGLLDQLSDTELEAVIAHEMSHIKNFDTRLMGIVAILAGSLALLSDIFFRQMFFSSIMGGGRSNDRGGGLFLVLAIVAAILAPIAATLIQLAISRKREFLADADASLLTRYPEGLASALEKISNYSKPMKHASNATAHLYIENPFGADRGKKSSWFVNLFSTHPPVQERIKVLRSL